MCGICGKLVWQQDGTYETLIQQMNDTQAHRGPDDEGFRVYRAEDVQVALGHRRLSVIDLSDAGHQPLANETNEICIVYNGEVYNYKELRCQLKGMGHSFRSLTDTEVVLKAYQAWGRRCVERLRGMFAFCIWDQRKRRLFLARDRTGIKPLYYSTDSSGLLFGSELKALLLDQDLDRSLSFSALDSYFTYGYISAPDTIFQRIQKLPPGHSLTWENGSIQVARYWRYEPKPDQSKKTEEDWVDELQGTFRAAVSRQMVSDVPLGAFLSGGIDSSLIVWAMAQNTNQSVQTFSIGFDDEPSSETRFARIVAQHLGVEHHEFNVTTDALAILPNLVWHMDEPFGDSSIVPTYYVSQMTRKQVTVALSGDGGDELFAGYTRYQGERFSRVFRGLPGTLRKFLVNTTRLSKGNRRVRRLANVLSNAELDFVSRYRNKGSLCSPGIREEIYSADFKNALISNEPSDPLLEICSKHQQSDYVDRLTAFDMESYLPNDMLMKVDKMSMASSLEVRVPFLDEEFVTFASRVPSRLKLRGFTTKFLLRKLASRVLPREICKRRKQGFGMPVQSWFRGSLVDATREILLDSSAISRRYLRSSAVENLLQTHEAGFAEHGHIIFALLSFEHWGRIFVEGKGMRP
ncbi:MAG: asparagine synthase (glutamine-hydrolyzing) [Gemmatimonadetes bacterium]|nr:asparagine synthase (glutamine-hydrolyzing) [Gemmatimonadota bacterium]|tara:strand:- start:1814 stop:3715 length:1902 start_codon:yes stop_codon:yes gene_type:complete